MKLPLSNRLLTCCQFIHPGDRVADIGCDHGYLGIHLLQGRIASSVIASDINEGPLLSARRNAIKFGVSKKIEFYLSDGVRNIPRDFDDLVCAGMGADTMIHILESAPWLKNEKYPQILQSQSKPPMQRRYLSENRWRINEEPELRDGRFLYTVLEAGYRPEYPKLTVGEWYFPPALLENPSFEVPAYFRWVTEGLRIATAHKDDPEKKQALAELEALAKDENLSFLTEERK